MGKTYDELVKNQFEKHNISYSEANTVSAKPTKEIQKTGKDGYDAVIGNIVSKRSNKSETSSGWVDRYKNVVRNYSSYKTRNGKKYNKEYGKDFTAEIKSLIDEYERSRGNGGRWDQDMSAAVGTLKRIQGDISSVNRYMSGFENERDYTRLLDFQTPEGREKRISESNARLEELRKEREGLSGFENPLYRLAISSIGGDEYAAQSFLKDRDRRSAIDQEISEIEEDLGIFNSMIDEERIRTLDQDAAAKEIKALEEERKRLEAVDIDWTDASQRAEYETRLEELDSQINQKQADLRRAEYIQHGEELASVADRSSENYDPEFSDFSAFSEEFNDSQDSQYRWINNQNNYRSTYSRNQAFADTLSVITGHKPSDGLPTTIENKFEKKGYDRLTEQEISIYNYYYAKEGPHKAQEYLDSIQETLNRRKAEGTFGAVEDNVALEYLFGVSAGLDQFESGMEGAMNALFGKAEYLPASEVQMVAQMIRQDLGDKGWNIGGNSVGQIGFDLITNTANMAPSMMVSMGLNMLAPGVGTTVGSAMMGLSSGGSAYQDAINRGYSKDQARGYGLLVGSSEAVLGELISGIPGIGGRFTDDVLAKFLTNVDDALIQAAAKIGGNALSEFSEEYLQEILTPVFENLALGTDQDIQLLTPEAIYSGILGALTAGILESPGTIYNEVKTYKTGKKLQSVDAGARLAQIGSTYSADSVAHQLAGKVNENTGAYTIGRLFNEINATLTEENEASITRYLTGKRMSEDVARANARVMAAVIDGGTMPDLFVDIVESNNILADAMREVIINPNSTVLQRSKNYKDILRELANEMVGAKNTETNTNAGEEETPAQGSAEAPKAPGFKNISSVKNGVKVRLEDDSEVSLKDADISPDDSVRIETIARVNGMTPESADFVFKILKTNTGFSAREDALGAKEAFEYGYHGFSMDHLKKHALFNNSLTDAQRKAIYEEGQRARNQEIEKTTPRKGTGSKSTGIYFDNGGGNVVAFNEGKPEKMNERKSAGVQAARVLKALGIGGDIYFFESYLNDGKRVYKDKDGNEVKAPNGWYDRKDGSIHIDLNAGDRGTVLFTLSHELTHFIEEWSPKKYKVLADFLIKEYEKGQSMDALVRKKQKDLSDARGKAVGYEEAFSEVVANSMEAMLADGNVMDKIVRLKAQDRSLFDKMKAFFDNLITKIRNAYKGIVPDSTEGYKVIKMTTDTIEQLQQLFAEALVESSDNFRTAEKNTTEENSESTAPDDTIRFDQRDIENVSIEISKFVDSSLADKKSNAEIEVSFASQWDNQAINKLGPHWKGKYTGALRTFTSRYVRHVVKQHGDPVTEALRGQLHMDADAIKIALSNLKAGKGRVIEGTYAKRGTPTIITEIPINGYTIYAEEPVQTLSGIELSGRTMYMTPTSTKALMPTWSANIPQRRSEGHKVIIDGKKRIVNGFLANAGGNIAEVNYIDLNGNAFAGGATRFLFTMCNDTDVLLEYAPNGATVEKARVAIKNPYIVTTQNPVFSTEDLEQGVVGDRIKEIRNLGFDAIIMDYKPGDNYMVMVFDNKAIVKPSDQYSDGRDSIPTTQHSDRTNESVSSRTILANALESTVQTDWERRKLQEYKDNISKIEEQEAKLQQLNAQIRELSFAKGPRDKAKLTELRIEATKTTNRINIYDKILLRLEAAKPLQDILARERKNIREKGKADTRKAVADYKKSAELKQQETLREYRALRAETKGIRDDYRIIEKEFIRIAREYEKSRKESGKTISDLRKALDAETRKHSRESAKWAHEFTVLLKEYDAADQKISALEAKIKYQRDSAKRKVDGRKKTELRNKISDVIHDIDGMLNRGNKKRNVKEGMRDFVSEALSSAQILFTQNFTDEEMITRGIATDMTEEEVSLLDEVRSLRYELGHLSENDYKKSEAVQRKLKPKMSKLKDLFARERARLNKATVSDALGKLAEAYSKLQSSEYAYVQGAYQEEVYEYLKELNNKIGGTYIRDMTRDQLEEVYKAYIMVKTTIYNANKMFAANLKQNVDTLAAQSIGEIRKIKGKDKRTDAGRNLNTFSWNNEKPVYAFERLGSDTFKKLFGNIRKGQDVWAIDLNEADEFRRGIYKKYNKKSWDTEKTYSFQSSGGARFELTLDQIMSLYAYSKRDQAYDHLMRGGIVFDNDTETVTKKLGIPITYKNESAVSYNLSPEILDDIVSKLTPQQKAFVDDMQQYLSDTMGDKGNEISLQLYGIKLFNEENYFPLRSAGQYMERAKEADMKKQQGFSTIVGAGFAKSVKPNASNPVVLSNFMDVWADHVNEMSMYHAFVLPLEDFRRVYNFSSPNVEGEDSVSVYSVIQNTHGKAAVDYLDQLYRDLNGGALTDNTAGMMNKFMSLFKKGAVFASASVVIQQPSAIARAFALIDYKYFIGPKVGDTQRKLIWPEVKKYAPVAFIKDMGYFDTGMGRSARDYLQTEEYVGVKEMAKGALTDADYRDEILSKGPALADQITWCSIWQAVKRETKAKHPNMDVKSEAFLKLCGERFSEVIDKTQVYDSVLSRSANMRSKDTGMKMVTAFLSEPTTSINMIEDAVRKGRQGDKKYAARAIGAVVASMIFNSVLVSLVEAGRDDDDDQTYWEKYLESFAANLADGINPATYIPFVKDVVSIFQGYDVNRSDMSIFADIYNAFQQLSKENVSGWKKVEDFAGSIFKLAGIPLKNIMRDLRTAKQVYDTFTNGEKNTWSGTGYAAMEGFFGVTTSQQQQLLEAYIDDDTDHAARIEARYQDEKKLKSAVKSAIRERYLDGDIDKAEAREYLISFTGEEIDDTYWTIKEWDHQNEVGNSEDKFIKYEPFYEAVMSGENLDAVIKEFTDNGVEMEALSSQLSDHFRVKYINAASDEERKQIADAVIEAKVHMGTYRDNAEKLIGEWDFAVEHGGESYDDMVKAYKRSEISREEMIAYMMEVGKTEDDIESTIIDYDIVREYGINYKEREVAYREGRIDANDLREIYAMKNYEPDEIEALIEAHDWLKARPEYNGVYASDVKKYLAPIKELGYNLEDAGITLEQYQYYVEKANDCTGVDSNGDGKADSGSEKKQKLDLINSMNLTREQKDTFYYFNKWSKKSIKKTPWY